MKIIQQRLVLRGALVRLGAGRSGECFEINIVVTHMKDDVRVSFIELAKVVSRPKFDVKLLNAPNLQTRFLPSY